MTASVNLKSPDAALAPNIPKVGDIGAALSRLIRQIFPQKTWMCLGNLIGTTERVSKHRLSGTRSFTVEELASLLRSNHGRHVLAVLMGNSNAAWYLRLRQQDAIAAARGSLARAIDTANQITAALERTETALAVRDADFHQPDIDGLRAAHGAQDFTLATTKLK